MRAHQVFVIWLITFSSMSHIHKFFKDKVVLEGLLYTHHTVNSELSTLKACAQ